MSVYATVALALWALLFGLGVFTNVRFEWMRPLTGLTALLAGALLLVDVVRRGKKR